MLGPGRDADPLGPAQRGDVDRRPADRLDDRDRDVHLEVVSAAAEHGRVAHARDRVQIAWRAAAPARLALAGQAHPAAVADAGGDVDPVALHLASLPAALAGGARILDLGPRAAALRAGL